MNSPTVKYIVKCVGVGVYGALVSLSAAQVVATIDTDALIAAVIAGGIGALAFAGLAYTPLENPKGEPPAV